MNPSEPTALAASGALRLKQREETPMSRQRREAFNTFVRQSKLSDPEFAAKYKIERSLISQLRNGHRSLGEKAAREIEIKLGFAPGGLFKGDASPPPATDDDFVTVPMIVGAQLAAGSGAVLIDHEIAAGVPRAYTRSFFISNGYNPKKCEAMKVRGASMEPTLFDGDTVLINKEDTRLRHGLVYAFTSVEDGEVTLLIKRAHRVDDRWELHSDNKSSRFPTIPMTEHISVLGLAIDRSSSVF